MNDWISYILSAETIRNGSILCNLVAAFFIGPYLAFAATPDAGFRCFQTFVRMIHRIILVAFAIALMNNAMVLVGSDRTPTGSAFSLNVFILVSVLISAARYYWWMGDVPADSSWERPHFAVRRHHGT